MHSYNLEHEQIEEENNNLLNFVNQSTYEKLPDKPQLSYKGGYKKIDIIVKLLISIINKEDERKQCICSYKPVENENHPTYTEDEVIPGVRIPCNKNGNIDLSNIIKTLKNFGYPLTGSMIQVYSYDLKQYILFGNSVNQSMILKDKDLIYDNVVRMKCTCFIDEAYIPKFEHDSNNLNVSSLSEDNSEEKGRKKHKERKIGYIIEKVSAWRKLYNGFFDESGKFIKLSLLDAAKEINIPKKTLDDYLRQLRLGRKFGYDFNKNTDSKVGNLREFVKKKNLVITKIKKKTSTNVTIASKVDKERESDI